MLSCLPGISSKNPTQGDACLGAPEQSPLALSLALYIWSSVNPCQFSNIATVPILVQTTIILHLDYENSFLHILLPSCLLHWSPNTNPTIKNLFRWSAWNSLQKWAPLSSSGLALPTQGDLRDPRSVLIPYGNLQDPKTNQFGNLFHQSHPSRICPLSHLGPSA